MTDNEKLAAIEAKINGYPANGVWYATYSMQVGPSDVRWLIAEVRRLTPFEATAKHFQMFMDAIETHFRSDNLPSDGPADNSLNAWLRMRAARDEAIADVRRLTDENESACEKIKELTVMLENATTAIGTWKGEYERGRQEERAAVVAWLYGETMKRGKLDTEQKRMTGVLVYHLMQQIERGEHLENK